MGKISKLLHYSIDLVLVSTVVAGIRRSTGLTPKVDSIENAEARSLVAKYFETGEWIFDTGSTLMAGSSYFERKIR